MISRSSSAAAISSATRMLGSSGTGGHRHDRAGCTRDPSRHNENSAAVSNAASKQTGELPRDPLARMRRLDDGDDIVAADERGYHLRRRNDIEARLYGAALLTAFGKAPARDAGGAVRYRA